MALAARGRVEEGPESRWRGEHAVEHDLAPVEAVSLRTGEPAQRVAGLERSLTPRREQHERGGPNGAPRRHGARLFNSIRSAMRPLAVRRQSARTTSPGWRSPSA